MQTLIAADVIVVQTTCPAENLPRAVQKYASPSGAYCLTIQAETTEQLPGDSGGPVAAFGSKSRCRLMRGTTVVWDKKLPFVMSDVIVTDQGLSVGVAFKHSPLAAKDRTRHLYLFILDVTGERLLFEEHLREQSRKMVAFPATPAYPDPIQVAVSPELNRVVFWLKEATQDCNRFEDVVFRVYELSTGDRKAIVYYDNINPQPKAYRLLDDVRPVVSPELLMLHYVHYRPNTTRWPPDYYSESMELVDVRGLVVWQKSTDNPRIEEDPSFRPMDGANQQYLNCSRITSTKSGLVIKNGATSHISEFSVLKEKSNWVVSEVKATTSNRAAP